MLHLIADVRVALQLLEGKHEMCDETVFLMKQLVSCTVVHTACNNVSYAKGSSDFICLSCLSKLITADVAVMQSKQNE